MSYGCECNEKLEAKTEGLEGPGLSLSHRSTKKKRYIKEKMEENRRGRSLVMI